MKKFTQILLAALIAAVSCQKGSMNDGLPVGETAEVTFTIDVPGGLQSKAIADGTMATELYYAVYNADKTKHIESLDGVTPVQATIDGKRGWTLKLTLVKNYTYHIFFWAQAENAPYTLDKDNGTVTVSYEGNANDESRDAFCYLATVDVPDDVQYFSPNDGKPYELRRPFAQINFGATDYDAITELGLAMESTVTINGLPNVYNFLTGELSGSEDTDLSLAKIPAEDGEELKIGGNTYGYVGMNYILAPENTFDSDGNVEISRKTATAMTATFSYNDTKFDIEVTNVPYQRNFRTNIVGNFFSGDVQVQVIIVESFESRDEIVEYE